MIVEGISKSYGDTLALREVSLQLAAGEAVGLLGPSGCGKTTLLRAIAGLIGVDSGRVEIGGVDVSGLPPHRRNVGFVFQDLTLYPHMRVDENLAFPLRGRGVGRTERVRRVAEVADLVGVSQLLQRYPEQLSGGERQRVAIGRGLVHRPGVLLLDEPLSHLDPHLRLRLREEINRWRAAVGASALYVTHDANEAMAVADRVLVMEAGQIIQRGTVEEIYRQPSSEFVAALLGMLPINALEARRQTGRGWQCGGAELPASVVPAAAEDRCRVAFRPEEVTIAAPTEEPSATTRDGLEVCGRVHGRFRFHDRHCLVIEAEGATLRALVAPATRWRRGSDVILRVPYAALHFFTADAQARRLHP